MISIKANSIEAREKVVGVNNDWAMNDEILALSSDALV